MTTVTLIGILITFLILLLIVFVILLTWHRKRQSLSKFEQVLASINDQQNIRSGTLSRQIIKKLQIDPINAQSLSKQLISAEKLFLHYFINQQIQQQPLDEFYTQLCVLLDSYFNINPSQENTKEATATQIIDNSAANQKETSATEQESKSDSEPEWGDVFD